MKADRATINRKRRQFRELKLLGVSDIARQLGWTNSKVVTYVNRGKLPQPVGEVGGRPVWLEVELKPYFRELGEWTEPSAK